MDVKIDRDFIRSARRNRGWSQEQLAAAAGLGLRTIQRVESSGTSSGETATCLAAVFEVPVASLIEKAQSPRSRARIWAAGTAAFVALTASLVIMSRADAKDVAMAVVLSTGISENSHMNLEVASGRQTEIKLERDVRLLLTPTIRKDGTILVATEVYDWNGSDFQLAGKPSILLRQGADTGLHLRLGGGRSATIRITAKMVARYQADL